MGSVSGINSSINGYLGSDTGLKDLRTLMRERALEADEALQQGTSITEQKTSAPSAALQSGFSVMSGNFANAPRSSSRYVESTLAGFGEKTLLELSQNNGLFGILDEVAAFAKSYSSAEIEGIVARSRDKKLYAEVEKKTEEMKAELERKAAEAAAPKDANGEPIIIDPKVENSSPASSAPALGDSIDIATPDVADSVVSSAQAVATAATARRSIDIVV